MSEPEYDSLDSPAAVDEGESDQSGELAGLEPLEQNRPSASLEDGESEEESEEEAEGQSVSGAPGKDDDYVASEVVGDEESGRSGSEREEEEEGEGEEKERDEVESSDEEITRSAEAKEESETSHAEPSEGIKTHLYILINAHLSVLSGVKSHVFDESEEEEEREGEEEEEGGRGAKEEEGGEDKRGDGGEEFVDLEQGATEGERTGTDDVPTVSAGGRRFLDDLDEELEPEQQSTEREEGDRRHERYIQCTCTCVCRQKQALWDESEERVQGLLFTCMVELPVANS